MKEENCFQQTYLCVYMRAQSQIGKIVSLRRNGRPRPFLDDEKSLENTVTKRFAISLQRQKPIPQIFKWIKSSGPLGKKSAQCKGERARPSGSEEIRASSSIVPINGVLVRSAVTLPCQRWGNISWIISGLWIRIASHIWLTCKFHYTVTKLSQD